MQFNSRNMSICVSLVQNEPMWKKQVLHFNWADAHGAMVFSHRVQRHQKVLSKMFWVTALKALW